MPESHPVNIHAAPPGFDLIGGPWVAAQLDTLTIGGKAVVCLSCGAVVAPQLTDVHEQQHGKAAQ